ncbi:protein of unknown function [Bartonella clarridgeiae 73]|uniref:Uncharacterized protein n=1 Tax=Bartonella clarridgeiae (strain CCUG 45776 / CIP 104772 / 73) TaxID=696125 RepID=E6YGL4_BARC7|nr:protein of unknown function [Bartonella clarridgeiae 73]
MTIVQASIDEEGACK